MKILIFTYRAAYVTSYGHKIKNTFFEQAGTCCENVRVLLARTCRSCCIGFCQLSRYYNIEKAPPVLSYENRSFSVGGNPIRKQTSFASLAKDRSHFRAAISTSRNKSRAATFTAAIISAGIISTISLSGLKYSDYRSWRSCSDWAIEIQHGIFIKSSRWDFCPAQIALRNISLWYYRVCSSR